MGLFSSKKKVYVSSTAYNMAGELAKRPNYLKTTVARATLFGSPKVSLGEEIVRAQLNGPTMDQRGFYRWAGNNFKEGTFLGTLTNQKHLTASAIAEASAGITVPPGYILQVQSALVDSADIAYWAERHILATRPEDYGTDWVADYDTTTNRMVITYADASVESVVVSDFVPTAEFIFIYYTMVNPDSSDGWVTGSVILDQPSRYVTAGADPAWVRDSYNFNTTLETLNRTVTTEDFSGTTVENSSQDMFAITSTEILGRSVFLGADPDAPRLRHRNEALSIWQRYRIAVEETVEEEPGAIAEGTGYGNGYSFSYGSVTESGYGMVYGEHYGGLTMGQRRVTTVQEYLEYLWDHRLDTELVYSSDTTGNQALMIYRIGSGNAVLDALMEQISSISEFFPIIPLRLHTRSIAHQNYEDIFPKVKKAFKKVTGAKIEKTLDEIDDHRNAGDIDHAYVVHGVELNCYEKVGKRYIYEFLKELMAYQSVSVAQMEAWLNGGALTFEAFAQLYLAWFKAQADPQDPLYGTPKPVFQPRPLQSHTTLKMRSDPNVDFPLQYQIFLHWNAIGETQHTGLGKAEAKKGDLWWGEPATYDLGGFVVTPTTWAGAITTSGQRTNKVELYWQHSHDAYSKLTCFGLRHENLIYAGKSVVITAKEALEDNDESGFIVPLHYGTLRKLPILQANELAITNKLVVFNSFQVVKQRWWQRGIFKFLLAIVVAVVVGLVFPAAGGLLGSNLFVGTTLGFSGTTALIVGAVANAMAAMFLSMIIEFAATALFGDQWGGLIASIVTFFAFHAVSNFFANGSFSLNWTELMKADNLLRLTDSVLRGVGHWAQGEINRVQGKLEAGYDDYLAQLRKIERQTVEVLGYGDVLLDPLLLTETQDNPVYTESSAVFLTRTLMTGPDIADLSLSMIDSFAEISLTLPTAND